MIRDVGLDVLAAASSIELQTLNERVLPIWLHEFTSLPVPLILLTLIISEATD